MQLNKVQRIEDTSPRVLAIISKTMRSYADQAVEILSKWSLWYLLQEIADRYTRGLNAIPAFSDEFSDIFINYIKIESSLKNVADLPLALKAELIELKRLLDYISVEHGKSQLVLSRTMDGVDWISLKTRWSINIILWSKNETDMQAALWK